MKLNSRFFSCSLSGDESALFCNSISNSNDPMILKFNTSTTDIYSATVSTSGSPGRNLVSINNAEVFYHLEDTNYHFVKSTFSYNGALTEQYHQVMAGPSGENAAVAIVDESEQTIWHGVANYDIIYFQHNLSDFSLIGSKYATGTRYISANVFDISITENSVFIYSQTDEGLLIKINKQASGKI